MEAIVAGVVPPMRPSPACLPTATGVAEGWRETYTWRGNCNWSRAWVGLTVILNVPPPCPAAMPILPDSHLPQSHPTQDRFQMPRPVCHRHQCMGLPGVQIHQNNYKWTRGAFWQYNTYKARGIPRKICNVATLATD